MANFNSSLTGQQLNDALRQVEARIPEGWAVGTYDGVPVGSNSPYFHNNAKYFAALAQSAVPSGTSGALFWNVDQSATLSSSDKAQARKNIMAGGSNRNLLDNPFFTVNQRGATSASGTGAFTHKKYRMDRWFTTYSLFPNTGSWDLTDGVLTIDNSGTTNRGLFCQRVENHAWLNGKQVTASVLFADGTIKSGTITRVDNRGQNLGISGMSCEFSAENNLLVGPSSGGTIAIKAVKLELGSYSTLANDAPPNYAEELTKCKYYYRELIIGSGSSLGVGWAYSNSGAVIPNIFGYGMQMRAKPSITFTGVFRLRTTSGTDIAVTSFSAGSDITAQSMDALVSSGLTANQPVRLQGSAGSRLIFSADL